MSMSVSLCGLRALPLRRLRPPPAAAFFVDAFALALGAEEESFVDDFEPRCFFEGDGSTAISVVLLSTESSFRALRFLCKLHCISEHASIKEVTL